MAKAGGITGGGVWWSVIITVIPSIVGVFDFFDIGNSAIHGDDQGHTLIMQLFNGRCCADRDLR